MEKAAQTAGPIETRMRELLDLAFLPVHLDLQNESHTHNVPTNSETHFKLLIVSARFEAQTRVQRHRLVNTALAELIKPGGVHALTMKTLTPLEWSENGAVEVTSPPCLGGGRNLKN